MTDQAAPAGDGFLERRFGLKGQGTTPRTEVVAGFTTFLTMVYIVFVNPQILGNAGMDKGAVFVATCIAAAVSTFVMALYANYPIALAPGMGLNAFFAFTVVLTYKYSWQQALAAVFCSGVIFFLISIFRIREYIINSIPKNLKLAISAGVGLFLGIIALEEAKIVVANQATLVSLGDLKQPAAMLCLLGFVTRCRSPIRSRPASARASSPTLAKIIAGKFSDVSAAVLVLAILFAAKFYWVG